MGAASGPTPASAWFRDPWVWASTVLGAGALAAVFFAGRYLPYIDWSNHVALMAAFAHGGETGATAYLERSWLPTPYLLFYAWTAVAGQAMPVEAAAKLGLCVAGTAFVPSAAWLASECGRSPRLGAVAPLALFGYALGYGFGAFVFALPLLPATLAAGERLLDGIARDLCLRVLRRRALGLAALLALSFLGHAFVFGAAAGCLLVRTMAFGLVRARWKLLPRTASAVGLAFVPSVLLAVPKGLDLLRNPFREAGTAPAGPWMTFVDRKAHFANWGGHFLERGSSAHWTTMQGVAALFVALCLWSLWRSHPDSRFVSKESIRPKYGLEIHASLLAALYGFGPVSIEWPAAVWMVYPRFATLAALFVFLLPRADLRGWPQVAFFAAAAALVVDNSRINRGHIRGFSALARRYDAVRERIPPGSRVLSLMYGRATDDFTRFHPALGSLFFHHMADGAAWVSYLFDNPLHPVHPRDDRPLPRAPFWRTPGAFRPDMHGRDFDWVILRGEPLVRRTLRADLHVPVATIHGWHIFRTRHPRSLD
jgi:hypothetical protein